MQTVLEPAPISAEYNPAGQSGVFLNKKKLREEERKKRERRREKEERRIKKLIKFQNSKIRFTLYK